MEEKGLLPRGDPQDEVIHIFKIRACEIFLNLPKKDDIIHIKFKCVPCPPFPMLSSHSSLPSKGLLKLFICPGVCNSPPSQLHCLSTCGYVLCLTFTWEDRAQMSNADQKQSLFWMMVNHKFTLLLEVMFKNCDTEVRLVAHSDTIKSGKRS